MSPAGARLDRGRWLIKSASVISALPTSTAARVLVSAALVLVMVGGFLPWAVHGFGGLEGDDSGVFMYIGQQVAQGKMLYREVWDNKPPLIYYLNAAGAGLTPGSAAGVFSVCLASALLFILMLQRVLGRVAPVPWSGAIALLVVAGFFTLAPTPNFTETFSLPVDVAGLLILSRQDKNRGRNGEAFAMGCLTALLFNLRPNNIGLSAAYLLLAAWRDRRAPFVLLRCLGLVSGGFAAVCVALYTPLFHWGAFGDFVAAAFALGVRYASVSTIGARLTCLAICCATLLFSPLGIATAGTAIVSVRRAFPRGRHLEILVLCGLWLSIEMVSSTASGYSWSHYYLLCLTPLAMICAVFTAAILDGRTTRTSRMVGWSLVASISIIMLAQHSARLKQARRQPDQLSIPLGLIRRHSRPAEAVFTWGPVPRSLWFNQNHPPAVPDFHGTGYSNPALYRPLANQVIDKLERTPPPVILERRSIVPLLAAPNDSLPLGDGTDPEFFRGWDDGELAARKRSLAERYQEVERRGGYVVFRQRGNTLLAPR